MTCTNVNVSVVYRNIASVAAVVITGDVDPCLSVRMVRGREPTRAQNKQPAFTAV